MPRGAVESASAAARGMHEYPCHHHHQSLFCQFPCLPFESIIRSWLDATSTWRSTESLPPRPKLHETTPSGFKSAIVGCSRLGSIICRQGVLGRRQNHNIVIKVLLTACFIDLAQTPGRIFFICTSPCHYFESRPMGKNGHNSATDNTQQG